jgi:hypothetical protein
VKKFSSLCENGLQAKDVEDFILAMQNIASSGFTELYESGWKAVARSKSTLIPTQGDDELPWIKFLRTNPEFVAESLIQSYHKGCFANPYTVGQSLPSFDPTARKFPRKRFD